MEWAAIGAVSYIVLYIIILWHRAGIWNDMRFLLARAMVPSVLAVLAYHVNFPQKKLTSPLQCTRVIYHVCHLNARALEVH